MNQQIEINGNRISFVLHVLHSKSEEFFIMYNPALNVSGYGTTSSKATESFQINLQVFFDDLIEANTLHQTLKEYGWNFNDHSFNRGQLVEDFIKNLPMNIISSDQYQGAISL